MRILTTHHVDAFNRMHVRVTSFPKTHVPGDDKYPNDPYDCCDLYTLEIAGDAVNGGVHETELSFQTGPVKEAGVNGISNEALLAVLIDRLQCFQRGPQRCRENSIALTKLEEAMHWLAARSRDREARGVEGASDP